jgi:predicted transcriptional regulator
VSWPIARLLSHERFQLLFSNNSRRACGHRFFASAKGWISIVDGNQGKILFMEIFLAPEREAELKRVAARQGRPAQQVVQELVETYLDHEDWFRQEVGKGLASLDRGESVSHEEVGKRMERAFNS